MKRASIAWTTTCERSKRRIRPRRADWLA
jgi:hypothetical protein